MMTLSEAFAMSLNEFGEKLGLDLAMEDGRCNFCVDDVIEVEIDYLEEADVVVAWAIVGLALEDEFQGERACALLALNELNEANGGFSISMDPETRRVIAHDHRPAEMFESGDRIAAWVDALVELVNHIRSDFEVRFPSSDMPFGDEESVEEGVR